MIYRIYLFTFLIIGLCFSFVYAAEQETITDEIKGACLGLKHGDMMRCIKKGMEATREDGQEGLSLKESEEETAWQAPDEYLERTNPQIPNEESITVGAKIYSFNCSGCHGPDGLGEGTGEKKFSKSIPDLTNPLLKEKTDGALFWKITEGSWPMPAFWEGDVLSEEELWHLINYLRSLSRK